MPTYEFFCEKCRKPFTLVLRLAEYEKGNFKCTPGKGWETRHETR